MEKSKLFSEFSETTEKLIDDYQREKKRVLKVMNEVLEDQVDRIFKNFYNKCFENINKVSQVANVEQKINFVTKKLNMVEMLEKFHQRKSHLRDLGERITKSLKSLIENNLLTQSETNLIKKQESESTVPWSRRFLQSTDHTSKIEKEDYQSKETNSIAKIFSIGGDYNNKSYFSDKTCELGRTASNLEESDLSMSKIESQNISISSTRKILMKNSRKTSDNRGIELEKVQTTCISCNTQFFLFRKELDWKKECSSCAKQMD
jgi:hypothetical protein